MQGDYARRDEDGLWYLLGRSDDTLKIAGKRTGPAEPAAYLAHDVVQRPLALKGPPGVLAGSGLGIAVDERRLADLSIRSTAATPG